MAGRARDRIELRRRGVWHGWLDEPGICPDGVTNDLPATWARRWHAGQPIVLRGFARPLEAVEEVLADREALRHEIATPGGLLAFLSARRSALEPEFELWGHAPPNKERALEIERVRCTWSADPTRRGPIMRDLWIASAWLSGHADDDSSCIRVGFGHGGDDLDRLDLARHRRTAELAERAMPEIALVQASEELVALVERLSGEEILFTRHAACWIGREGGASFRDGTFPEDALGRDLAACWVGLAGRTVWLALARDELAERVIAWAAILAEERSAWLLAQIFPRPLERLRFLADASQPERVRAELDKPRCGALQALVERGAEFTAELAAAGHAYVVRPGDVLLLPRPATERSALASCFGVDASPAYGLWLGVRKSEAPPEVAAAWHEARQARRERRRRGADPREEE